MNTEHENSEAVVEDLFDFSDFDADFQKAELVERLTEAPDGKYLVKINKVVVNKTSSGKRQLNLHLPIVSGKYKGMYLFKRYMLEKDSNFSYLKTDLATLGLKAKTLTEAVERREELLDMFVNVTKRKKDPTSTFYDVYINSLGDEPSADDEPVSEGEDIPF